MRDTPCRSGATVSELVDDYLADIASHKLNGKKATTIKSDRSRIENHIRPRLGKFRVAAITQSQIEDWMNQSPPGSARTLVAMLSSIFTFAIRKGLRGDNPCKGIVKPKDNHKTRRLSEIEYVQLWKAIGSAPPTLASVVTFLTITGWRSGESKNLRWSELDIPRQIATLADTKSGQSIRPLSAEAIKIIEAQPRDGEYVFERRGIANLNQSFARLGMDKTITPHVLRHSFASLAPTWASQTT